MGGNIIREYIHQTLWAGYQGWSQWIVVKKRGFVMECCNCGSQHEIDFKIDKDNDIRMRARLTAKEIHYE